MRRMILICLAVALMMATPLWADENQSMSSRRQGSSYSDQGYEYMGPGMMGPGSGYHGRGPGMMDHGGRMGRGRYGRGHMMGPDPQGWNSMPPEHRERWREMRAQFMQDTLPLRQELSAKRMELETLWDQKNPDPEKVKSLSNRISELRTKLDQKHDEYLVQCRQEFGDLGWSCPGGGWRDN